MPGVNYVATDLSTITNISPDTPCQLCRDFRHCRGHHVLSRDIVPVVSRDFVIFGCPGLGWVRHSDGEIGRPGMVLPRSLNVPRIEPEQLSSDDPDGSRNRRPMNVKPLPRGRVLLLGHFACTRIARSRNDVSRHQFAPSRGCFWARVAHRNDVVRHTA